MSALWGEFLASLTIGGDSMPDRPLRRVAELYEEHREAVFPGRLIVDEANGIEMVSIDSRVSGCVHTWLKNRGRIDDGRWDTLAACEQLLIRAIPALDGDEASYYQRLLAMTGPDPGRPRGRAARMTSRRARAHGGRPDAGDVFSGSRLVRLKPHPVGPRTAMSQTPSPMDGRHNTEP